MPRTGEEVTLRLLLSMGDPGLKWLRQLSWAGAGSLKAGSLPALLPRLLHTDWWDVGSCKVRDMKGSPPNKGICLRVPEGTVAQTALFLSLEKRGL